MILLTSILLSGINFDYDKLTKYDQTFRQLDYIEYHEESNEHPFPNVKDDDIPYYDNTICPTEQYLMGACDLSQRAQKPVSKVVDVDLSRVDDWILVRLGLANMEYYDLLDLAMDMLKDITDDEFESFRYYTYNRLGLDRDFNEMVDQASATIYISDYKRMLQTSAELWLGSVIQKMDGLSFAEFFEVNGFLPTDRSVRDMQYNYDLRTTVTWTRYQDNKIPNVWAYDYQENIPENCAHTVGTVTLYWKERVKTIEDTWDANAIIDEYLGIENDYPNPLEVALDEYVDLRDFWLDVLE